jgi:hypothetical protein
MDSYSITIAANDDSGVVTRLVVDTAGGQVRITDVQLHAPSGLSSGQIPAIDVELLLQAVAPIGTARPGSTGADALPAVHPAAALEAATEPEEPRALAAPRRRTRKAASTATATPATRTASTRTAKQPAPRPASTGRKTKTPPAPVKKQAASARTVAPAKKTRAKRTRGTTPAAVATATGRVYRRTPDDLAAVFEQVETVAGVAEHYRVPRYTAQGWVSRLRAAE